MISCPNYSYFYRYGHGNVFILFICMFWINGNRFRHFVTRIVSNMDKEYRQIDGSHLEGGGQILRIATVLSSLLNIPIEIRNIRAGRPKPGLAPQHLHGLRIARDITNGHLLNAEIGSTSIQFCPSKINAGNYLTDIGTAGSVTLILQTAIPLLLYANGPSTLEIYGGTHVPFAPFVNFFTDILPDYLSFMKQIQIHCNRFGFYPQGGGHITCQIDPTTIQLPLQSIERIDFGELNEINGFVMISGRIRRPIAESNIQSAMEIFYNQQPKMIDENRINIFINECRTRNDVLAMMLSARTTTNCNLSSSSIVSRRNEMHTNIYGQKIAEKLCHDLQQQCCVDEFIQDQLIIYMALADGISRIITGEISLHTQTAIWITEQLTGVKFSIKSIDQSKQLNMIECKGLAYKPERYYS